VLWPGGRGGTCALVRKGLNLRGPRCPMEDRRASAPTQGTPPIPSTFGQGRGEKKRAAYRGEECRGLLMGKGGGEGRRAYTSPPKCPKRKGGSLFWQWKNDLARKNEKKISVWPSFAKKRGMGRERIHLPKKRTSSSQKGKKGKKKTLPRSFKGAWEEQRKACIGRSAS